MNDINKCYWFLGYSGTGKSTLAKCLVEHHKLVNKKVILLDGDELRKGLNANLGFSVEDRFENVRRTAEVTKLFLNEGYTVIVAMITPTEKMRQNNRTILGEAYFEIFVDTPFDVCRNRDVKGLYAKAIKNEIPNFTGIDSIFETPNQPHYIAKTVGLTIGESFEELLGSIF